MKYSLLIFGVLFLLGCQTAEPEVEKPDRYAHIQDKKAREIIKASIEHAGGIDRWESVKRLTYKKDFQLFLESGEVEKSFEQVHDYRWEEPASIDIRSIENGALIHTRLKNGHFSRTVDGKAATINQEVLEKAVNTSTYVVSMPFKLLDAGVKIKYLGEEMLFDNKVVDVIQLSYDAEQYDQHSTSDVWKYYFDKKDRKILANWVKTGDHFSLVENLTFERIGGILFNGKRKSYRVDSSGTKLYLRAEYDYYDYQIGPPDHAINKLGALERTDTTQAVIHLVFTAHEFADGGDFIRETLKNKSIPAHFFLTGDFYRNENHKKLIQQLIVDGHYLGAHSDRHLLYASWEKRDSLLISRSAFEKDVLDNYREMAVFGIQKEDAPYYMPPYEWYNQQISDWTEAIGLSLVNFSPGTRSNADYTTPDMPNYINSEKIYQSILNYESTSTNGMNGFILLIHLGTHPDRTDKFYSFLPQLIEELQNRGYRFAML